MFNCTTNNYERLYARWLQKPGELLEFAAFKPTDSVLDLCGGTGAISKEVLRLSNERARVALFDLNPRVEDHRIECITGDVNSGGLARVRSKFDLIVCRQALGYLKLNSLAEDLPRLLKPEGRFTFNTFVKPKWGIRSYRYEGRRYLEASAYLGPHVIHVQAGPGKSPASRIDFTVFRWYSSEEIDAVLSRTMELCRWSRIGKTLRMTYQTRA
jgi:SAM-dependent methyltransferase